jgi:3-oxoadipate enol-lactonase
VTRSAEVRLDHAGATLFALDQGEQGESPALLFFHGGLADHRAALLHVGALAGRLRLITPDLRGAGRSVWGGALSWAQLADDARAWVAHLGLPRVVVGGVSMGSAVALRTALSHPDVVAGLVVVRPALAGADVGLLPAQRAAFHAMDALGRRAPDEGVEVLLPLFDPLPEDVKVRARAMLASFDAASVAATTRFLVSGAQPFEDAAALGAVRCPALVVAGDDPTHPAEVARRIAGALPDARLHPQADVDVAGAIERFCRAIAQT